VRQATERLTTMVDADHQPPFDNDAVEDAERTLVYVRTVGMQLK
jgi:hypothetical protein